MEHSVTSRAETLRFFGGDELATDVFLKKYALTKQDGTVEEYLPSDMWRRMAKAAASVEKDKKFWEEQFFAVLDGWKAVPQGSIMFALGNPYQKSSCSNCFVVPILEDSLDGIFDAAKEMSKTYSYRGGVGTDITPLRPAGSIVTNAARTSTGAWSFMDFYSYITRLIGQHGRRGALMLSIGDNHPDLENFITSKTDRTKVTGANISVRISDKFMEAVEKDLPWEMSFTTRHETVKKVVPAKDIWNLITSTATKTAEPGILFWDTILRESPADCYAEDGFRTVSTNPCSEIPLAAYDACTLLSINLTKYTRQDFTPEADFDFEALERDIEVAVRFLDNVKEIDLKLMPLKKQQEVARKGRRIGMGTHGLADALLNMGFRYDSDEALKFVDKLYEFYAKAVYRASVKLGKEKGPFPLFDAKKEKNNPFLKRIGFAGVPRRNIACLTCAPTGSVSLLCQTSSGVEPVFRNFYKRRRKITHDEAINVPRDQLRQDQLGDYWQEYEVAHHNVQRYLTLQGVDLAKTGSAKIKLPDSFVESHQIDWQKRVEIQATMQQWIDHAISSTCNLPQGTPEEVVREVYMTAYEKGCKGFTVYVDGTRDGVLITKDEPDKKTINKTEAPKRPKVLDAHVYHITVKGQLYFVMVGMLGEDPYEVFAGKNGFIDRKVKHAKVIKRKRGHYEAILDDNTIIDNIADHITDEEAAITRLISLALRHGADICHCVEVLERVPGDMQNFGRCMARALKNYIPDGTPVAGRTCESCGSSNLARQEGCVRCLDCGTSGCS